MSLTELCSLAGPLVRTNAFVLFMISLGVVRLNLRFGQHQYVNRPSPLAIMSMVSANIDLFGLW